MDKYELVLDIVEHPEKYTSEQLAEIMSDPETREIYNQFCKTESAIDANEEVDVDAEWETFSEKHTVCPRRSKFWFGSRAASIAAIICTSIVAVAAGIAVTVVVIDHKPEPITENVVVAPSAVAVSTDTLTTKNDTVMVNMTPLVFENETLEKIMKEVAVVYGVEVKFSNADAASLHLYYKFDPSLPLHEVVEQLNTFEQIDIKQNGNILTID
ncbi:DUF4974 domain-containing protein [uncultured Bacteroides sp.]|uniref:DUF4974 domain-containing protein n=1 Tax=uncultured Bacteroides sp. TaxID=162156 RepID=UPI00267089E8|nr:DUF4974 domain-containing protein [uncultured Bacteroides sp.]